MLSGLLGTSSGLAGGLWGVLLLSSVSAEAVPGMIPDSYRAAWLALLHYRGGEGAWQSEVADPSFFLDAEGARSPEREWEAARRAFRAPTTASRPGTHAQCRFPARFALMKEALGWSEDAVPSISCPQLADHERRIAATSLWVVFASHYLNNPASAFGHTMLYLGSSEPRAAALSDYSVSFEADIGGMSPAEYLPRGFFGGLVAGYRLLPLHERVRKYVRNEQRDLWLFPLRLPQEQIDQLVRHLWELQDITYRYGFFGGNCAQKILALVHAVAPEFGVLPYGGLAVLPSEVARRLVERIGLAGKPMRRPSQWSEYSRRVAALGPTERAQLEEMVTFRRMPEQASPAVLSAALLRSEIETPYRSFRREAESEMHPDLLWRRTLWASRAATNQREARTVISTREASGPSLLQSHRPSRVTIRGGYRRHTGSVLSLGVRWLLHDAVDPHVGYPPVSSLEVARFELGVREPGTFFVDEATLVRIERLAPASSFQSAVAWKFDLGARRLAHDSESPLHIGTEVGVGLGAARLRPAYGVALYSMVGVRPGVAIARAGTSVLAAGIWSGGVVVRLPATVRLRASGEYTVSLPSLDGGQGAAHVVIRKGLLRDWDLELATILAPDRTGASLGLVAFR